MNEHTKGPFFYYVRRHGGRGVFEKFSLFLTRGEGVSRTFSRKQLVLVKLVKFPQKKSNQN